MFPGRLLTALCGMLLALFCLAACATTSPAPTAARPFARVDSILAASPLTPAETLRVTPLGNGRHASAVLIQLGPVARVPGHVHRDHDEVAHVVRGSARVRVGQEVRLVEAGAVVIIPVGTPHGAVAGLSGCAVVSTYAPLWDPADRHRDPRGDP